MYLASYSYFMSIDKPIADLKRFVLFSERTLFKRFAIICDCFQ